MWWRAVAHVEDGVLGLGALGDVGRDDLLALGDVGGRLLDVRRALLDGRLARGGG